MSIHRTVLVGALALALAGPVAASDMPAAQKLYEQAKAESDPARKQELLKSSIAAADTFEARVALGEVLQAQKQHVLAQAEFKQAVSLAGGDKARARATYLVGETLFAQGQREAAVELMRQSVKIHPWPQVLERLKAIEMDAIDKPVSAAAIATALDTGKARAFGVKAAVSLRIGFDLGSANLNAAGRNQAEQLGKALSGMTGKRFEIVGHTDKQGDEASNDKLSQRRAETVKAYLMEQHKIATTALSTLGKGERELLYPGDTPQDHALNRRVEVVVREN